MRPEFFPENIRSCLRMRKEMDAEKKNKYVELTSEFYDLVVNSESVSKSNVSVVVTSID